MPKLKLALKHYTHLIPKTPQPINPSPTFEAPHPIPLCVPWWDQSAALSAGTQYSPQDQFFAPTGSWLPNFKNWLPAMYDPDLHRKALIPDMLPITSWEQNLRTHLPPHVWDRIRKHVYASSGGRCEICAASGPLEAHERWTLHNETLVQELSQLMSVCPTCHKAFHLGFAKSSGMLPAVKQKLLQVNQWSPDEVDSQIQLAHDAWEQRAHWPWTLNLDYIYKNGLLYV